MSKYPNGYIPKINYWSGKVLSATTTAEREKALSSLQYFMEKEMARMVKQ
jgi:hypothetical protein